MRGGLLWGRTRQFFERRHLDKASRRKRIEDDLREQPEASESQMTLVSNRGFFNEAVGNAVVALVERAVRLGL
jgi:hypothetical protein